MEALINRYKRLLAATSTGCVRSLMNDIHWDAIWLLFVERGELEKRR